MIALVIRVTLNIPCIGIVLAYHRERVKRATFLRRFMLPMRPHAKISNGEILRSYDAAGGGDYSRSGSIKLPMSMPLAPPTLPQPTLLPPPAMPSPPTAKSFVRGGSIRSIRSNRSSEIGFEKIENELQLDKEAAAAAAAARYSMPPPLPPLEQPNRVKYKFAPTTLSNYEIIVRPSQTGEFRQEFVNVDDVKLLKTNNSRRVSSSGRRRSSRRARDTNNNTKNDESGVGVDSNLLIDMVDASTPSRKSDDLEAARPCLSSASSYLLLNDNEFKEKYINEIAKKGGRMINVANHRIYLPPVASGSSLITEQRKSASGTNFVALNPDVSAAHLDFTNETSVNSSSLLIYFILFHFISNLFIKLFKIFLLKTIRMLNTTRRPH